MTDPGPIASALAAHGLILRGGFDFGAAEDVPLGPEGKPARAVLLVGQAGAAPWPHFQRWRQHRPEVRGDPLDTWSREVIGAIAARFGARAVSPGDRPFLPFQQWAMRAEGLRPSPLGILMHPEYGLWHAWRGALLFGQRIAVRPPGKVVHPCDSCAAKPCLKACPVGAHAPAGFDHRACLTHVRGPGGEMCRTTGCLARNACPFGSACRQPAEVQAFHMSAFATPG
ncbi:MAG TPA: hypothetical protein PLL33_05255 [Paracoccus sp. (in: a-proteobacteria)]|nr:hypothetical protein [Paracoccus sp. (in: a-proteobacteria)]